jgi:hypothetical protein
MMQPSDLQMLIRVHQSLGIVVFVDAIAHGHADVLKGDLVLPRRFGEIHAASLP